MQNSIAGVCCALYLVSLKSAIVKHILYHTITGSFFPGDRHKDIKEEFLTWMVTMEELWLHYFTIIPKCRCLWLVSSHGHNVKFKAHMNTLLCVFSPDHCKQAHNPRPDLDSFCVINWCICASIAPWPKSPFWIFLLAVAPVGLRSVFQQQTPRRDARANTQVLE